MTYVGHGVVVSGGRIIFCTGSSVSASDQAEQRVYDAECALHAARSSGIDAWVRAAYDKLHEAVLRLG
jgi:hypothetical protein